MPLINLKLLSACSFVRAHLKKKFKSNFVDRQVITQDNIHTKWFVVHKTDPSVKYVVKCFKNEKQNVIQTHQLCYILFT